MKTMLNDDELLILSYGMGVYRVNSLKPLTKDSPTCIMLGVIDILQVNEDRYIVISNRGHLPSHMELAIQETEDFKQDEAFAIKHGSDLIKERFYHLHRTSVAE